MGCLGCQRYACSSIPHIYGLYFAKYCALYSDGFHHAVLGAWKHDQFTLCFDWWQNMAKYITSHKQSHFHKHIIIRQIKHTGDLCAPLPKHKSTSSKSFKAPSGCVPWQLVLLLNQHMCFYWNYIGHFRYTVRPQKTIIRPQKTIVSPVQNAI